MSLESIVNISITSNSRGVSRKSFGVPMVVGKHTAWLDKYREYSLGTALQSLVTDGIPVGSPIYQKVASIASSSPKPEKVIVGRLTTAFKQQVKIGVRDVVETGKVFAFNMRAPNNGVVTTISYTAVALDTPTLVATALELLVDAVTGITSAAAAGVITIDVDANNAMWQFEGLDTNLFTFEETTPDTSLATEIAAVKTAGAAFYGLILADCPSKARIKAVAAWAETQEILFGATSHDTENLNTGSTTSVMHELNAASYFRTFCIYSNDQNADAAAAWMSKHFVTNPGSATAAYKELAGVTVDTLSDSQIAEIESNMGNYYVSIASLPVTLQGKVASGEWIDTVRGRDWLTSRLRERIFGLLANAQKIPFTNKGATLVVKEVEAQIAEGIGATYISDEVKPVVTAPDVSTVSAANKIARTLPDVFFEATLAGAIHAVTVYGVLKV